MNKPKIIMVYNLVNSKGNKLQLLLGMNKELTNEYPRSTADEGYRWCFIGKHIPMPVRSMYWFNGFPEEVMLDWLKGNGWFPHTRVDMLGGYVKVYELPKGNECRSEWPETKALEDRACESAFLQALRLLVTHSGHRKAAYLYRLVKGGTFAGAELAVREMFDLQA